MKKKFASFLLTGKAATLPFYAPATLADGHMLPMHQHGEHMHMPDMGGPIMCDSETPDEFTLSLPDVQDGDAVFIFAAEDTATYEGMEDLKIGPTGLKLVANFLVFDGMMIDFDDVLSELFEYSNYTLGDEAGSVTLDVPSMGYPGTFHLQTFILRGENFDQFVFSELDSVTRGPEGCTTDSYGTPGGGDSGPYGPGAGGEPGGDSGTYGPGAGDMGPGGDGGTYGGTEPGGMEPGGMEPGGMEPDPGTGGGDAYGDGGAIAEAY
jgi:hypothetical protein